MEELLEILNDIDDSIDYENEKAMVDDRLLTSFAVINLVSEINDTFDVTVDIADMIPENFNSIEAIWNLIERLKEEQ